MNATDILTAPSAEQLARAAESNLAALFQAMAARLPGGEIITSKKISYYLTAPSNPMFKGIWGANLSPDEVDKIIDEVLAWFRVRQAPYAFWWIDADTRPGDLSDRLTLNGFTATMPGDACMVADLHQLNEVPAAPAGLTVVEVTDQQGMEDWRDAFCAASELPLSVGQAWADATRAAGAAQSPWRLYVGYLGGQSVATNILFTGAGVAGLYSVSTVPAMRRKGIGTAVTLKPLLDARAQGYRYGVLFASEMGYPVYQRLGFRDTGRKIGGCFWLNSV